MFLSQDSFSITFCKNQADKIVQDFDLLMYYDKDKLDQEVVFNNGFDKGHDSGFNEGRITISSSINSSPSYNGSVQGLYTNYLFFHLLSIFLGIKNLPSKK